MAFSHINMSKAFRNAKTAQTAYYHLSQANDFSPSQQTFNTPIATRLNLQQTNNLRTPTITYSSFNQRSKPYFTLLLIK